jgi:hypothetical protein
LVIQRTILANLQKKKLFEGHWELLRLKEKAGSLTWKWARIKRLGNKETWPQKND